MYNSNKRSSDKSEINSSGNARLSQDDQAAFTALFDGLLDIGLIHDQEGKILDVNSIGATILEWTPEELIGRNINDILEDSEDQILLGEESKFSDGGMIVESCFFSRSGKRIEVEARLSYLDLSGMACVLIVARDITQRKKDQETIARRDELLMNTIESLTHPFYIINADDYSIRIVNSAGRELGLEEGKYCHDVIHHQKSPCCFNSDDCLVAAIKKSLEPCFFEHEHIGSNGMKNKYVVYGYPVIGQSGEVEQVISYFLNVSGQRRAEQDFRFSEECFRNLMDYLPGVSVQGYSTDGTVRYWNNASREVYGYTAEEAIGRNLADLIIPEELIPVFEQALEIGKKATTSGELLPPGELLLLNKNGAQVPVYSIHTVVCLEGKENLMFCIDVDLSERKKMEVQLRESEERLRTLFENAPIGQYRTTPDGKVLMANPAMIQMLGYESLEDIKKIDIYAHGYATTDHRGKFLELIETNGEVDAYESTWLRKDGSIVDIEETARAIRGLDGKTVYYEGIVRDVTAKKQLENELIKASKLESIGLLAGGIAHDFNNLLGALVINLWTVKRCIDNPVELTKLIEDSEKITQRAKSLTNQLLTFSKGGLPVKKQLYIQEILQDTAALSLGGSKTKCELVIGENIPPVEVDEGQMGQVFSNLLINADQAMPEGGTVRICVDTCSVDQADNSSISPGRYVRISFTDSGHGIPPEYLSKVFDPYFTTKQKGSGLGLATAYSIVKKHGGNLVVESNESKGATFHVFLPALTTIESQEVGNSESAVSMGGKSLKILIMDDEETFRKSLKRILEIKGHRAWDVEDGRQAIAIYETELQNNSGFDVVIMDLTVPGGMGGEQTITELRNRYPDIKAIVTSGYYDDPVVANYLDYGFNGVLTKPFLVSDFLREISRVANIS